MQKELRDKWVAALRSGDYKQGINSLFPSRGRDNTYCCLGVLAVVGDIRPRYEGAGCRAPDGIEYDYPSYTTLASEQTNTLTHMNDTQRIPFSGIADWIEANVPAD